MAVHPEIFAILKGVNGLLGPAGVRAFLVGGLVRDLLLERSTADIDLAIDADPFEIGRMLADALSGTYLCLDEQNRISRVVVKAGENAARSWYIDLSALPAADLAADLARRDFSINALAIELAAFVKSPLEAAVLDPFQGRKALVARSIEALNPAVFQADPARLLRALRLAAELGFSISSATVQLMRRDAALICGVAGERSRDELLRILDSGGAGRQVIFMDDVGLLTALIPELEAARGVAQPKEHHWDVLVHSIKTVQAAEAVLRQDGWPFIPADWLAEAPWSPALAGHFASLVGFSSTHRSLLKLAALLHDVAKPETKIQIEDRTRFFGHTELGAQTAAAVLERLKFSRKESGLVELMVSDHMRPTQMSNAGRPTPRAIYRYLRDTGEAAVDILFLSLADHLAARGPELGRPDWQWHLEQTGYVLEQWQVQAQAPAPPRRLLDGHDLMREFALAPGPRLREILEALKEAQALGEISTRAEALSYVKNRLL